MPELKVVTDEVGIPTYVKDLSERIIWMIENKVKPGIYHVTNSGTPASRKEFAEEILKLSGKDTPVIPTTHKEFDRGTKVPEVSILNNTKLPEMRNWKEALKDFLNK
jgi:dTDP-4-dehydrorhamnose reductase